MLKKYLVVILLVAPCLFAAPAIAHTFLTTAPFVLGEERTTFVEKFKQEFGHLPAPLPGDAPGKTAVYTTPERDFAFAGFPPHSIVGFLSFSLMEDKLHKVEHVFGLHLSHVNDFWRYCYARLTQQFGQDQHTTPEDFFAPGQTQVRASWRTRSPGHNIFMYAQPLPPPYDMWIIINIAHVYGPLQFALLQHILGTHTD